MQAQTPIPTVWKTAGPSDLLTLESIIPPALRPRHFVLANSGGERENPKPGFLALLSGLHVNIVHDRDTPGQVGISKWLKALAPLAASVRAVQVPFPLTENHGKDLRDWLTTPNPSLPGSPLPTFDELLALAESCPPYAVGGAVVNPGVLPDLDSLLDGDGKGNGTRGGHEATDGSQGTDGSQDGKGSGKQKQSLSVPTAISNDFYSPTSESPLPLPVADIAKAIFHATDNWPRRVGKALFVDYRQSLSENHPDPIRWLMDVNYLMAWLQERCGIVGFNRGKGFVTKPELYAHFRLAAQQYTAIEYLPHWPPMQDHYYACRMDDAGQDSANKPSAASTPAEPGHYLALLLSRFRPATPADAYLILVMFATAFWGGGGGTRPVFVIDSDDGPGSGKTKLTDILSRLAGGAIELSQHANIDDIKTRLLSEDGLCCRVARLDNVKSMKLSWSDLESIITAPVISGRQLYQGEGRRPNTFTWLITLNGAALSADMAQRSIIIKVSRPPRNPLWEQETNELIAEHRDAIIADIIAFLKLPSPPHSDFTACTRWASWEQSVLSHLSYPGGPTPNAAAESQALILARQTTADVEVNEFEAVVEYFRQQIARYGYDSSHAVFVPSRIAGEWVNTALGERKNNVWAGRKLSQLCRDPKSPIQPHRTERTKGYTWSEHASGSLIDDDSTGVWYDLEEKVAAQQSERQFFRFRKDSGGYNGHDNHDNDGPESNGHGSSF